MNAPMLATEHLTVQFPGLKAVDDVSLSVERGELRVLLGANGAGKTTLMDLVSGKIKSTRGRVLIDGVDVTNWEEHRIARMGVGRKFQIPSVFRELTVRQNLAIASCESVAIFSNLGFSLSREQTRLIADTLHIIGLTAVSSRAAANLSHGERQWLELGIVIVQNPKVLLLDEPTAGMTQAETHKTAEIIRRLRGQYTIVVVEHDMAFIREIAERITVMHLGRVLAEGDIASIENNAQVRAAYLGTGGIQ
jgi:urea transport system ATP-binding protein